MPKKRGMDPEEFANFNERENRRQEKIEEDYAVSCKLNKKERQTLHMFFSRWMIPVGLTDEEVRICIALYPVREAMDKRIMDPLKNTSQGAEADPQKGMEALGKVLDGIRTFDIPRELHPHKPMTRRRFKIGIWKFLQQATGK